MRYAVGDDMRNGGALRRCVTVVRYAVDEDVRYGTLQCVTAVRFADTLRWCVTMVRYAVGDDVRYGALQCEFITSCARATVTTRPSTVALTSSI